MLVAAHVLQVVVLIGAPLGLARTLARRWSLPFGVFGIGLLTFVFGQVLQMGLAWTIRRGFEAGALPLPPPASAALVSAILAGLVAALTDEPVRLWALRRYLPTQTNACSGALLGLGHGGGQAMVGGLLVLWMATLALVFQGQTFEDMRQLGLEGRAAVRLGMRVFAWWEQSILDVAAALGREAALVVMHVGLSVAVACAPTRGWRFFGVAILAHAVASSAVAYAQETMPEPWIVATTYGGAASLGALAGLWASRSAWTPASSAPASVDEAGEEAPPSDRGDEDSSSAK